MKRPEARAADRRVTVALGVLTFVLAMLGSQHVPSGSAGPVAVEPVSMAFASAAAPAP